MARVLKRADYQELLIIIYRYSNYEKEKAIILYHYVIHKLSKNRFDDIYVEKLTIDTNLTDHSIKNFIIKDKDIERKLREYFSYYDVINIKSLVFDIMHKWKNE